MSPHHSDQMSQRSQVSRVSSVVKTLIVSGAQGTKGPSKGQGHLLSCRGTAKKETEQIAQQKTKNRQQQKQQHFTVLCSSQINFRENVFKSLNL